MTPLSKPLSKHLDKIVLLLSFGVLSAALYFVYAYHLSGSKKETIRSLDNALLLTKNMLEEEKSHALSLSLMLSQDQAFLRAYQDNNRARVNTIIQRKINRLEAQQGYRFEVQIHDAQIRTYLRSWDYNITGVPLTAFRSGIVQVKRTRKPVVSVEVGKRLNIKAISPIMLDGRYAGSVEVIEGFSRIEHKLAREGYTLFVLLNKRYLNIATTLRTHPVLQHRYVLVNNDRRKEALEALSSADLSQLGRYGYFGGGQTAFAYFQISDLHNNEMGYFIIAMASPTLSALPDYHESRFNDVNNSGEVIIR
ncbi:MAG TPA: hypothetical protein ENL04_03270 [Sulfuricurvum sp.]|nr:hypothetical protein [Sulfuricurvum sp.]